LCAAAAFVVAPAPGVVDEDTSHQAGGHAEKVRAILPADLPGIRQANEGLIHQRRRLQRMATALPPHIGPGEAAQLRLHERHQLVESPIVAVAPRSEELGDSPG
jgi:hypothetical protein